MKLQKQKGLGLNCQKRPAIFAYRDVLPSGTQKIIRRADKDHTLCRQCFKSIRDSIIAAKLAKED